MHSTIAVPGVRSMCPTAIAASNPEIVNDIDRLEIEWLGIRLEEWPADCQESLVKFWSEVKNAKDSEGNQKFPLSSSLATALCSLPVSNTTVESLKGHFPN